MRLGSHDFLMVAFFFLEGLMRESFVRSSESPFVFDSSSDASSTISSIWHTSRSQHQRFFGRRTVRKTYIGFLKIGCRPSSEFLGDFTQILGLVEGYRVFT